MAMANKVATQEDSRPTMDFLKGQPFKTFVLAADLSVPDSYPVQFAQALARDQHAHLILTHMADAALCQPAPPQIRLSPEEQAVAQDEFGALDREIHDAGGRESHLQAMEASVRSHRPCLLLLGTRARTHEARVILGGAARRFSLHCSCPVLVIGPPDNAQLARAGAWKRVLAATDFSSPATTALSLAHHLALDEMVALHCTSENVSQGGGQSLEMLRFMAPFNESHTVPVMHIVQKGEPGPVIGTLADSLRPDLIVLGGPEEELEDMELASSTVCKVIEYASCPVLLISQSHPQAPSLPVTEEVCVGQ